jgi:uncharacterized protein (TIGR03083 family)
MHNTTTQRATVSTDVEALYRHERDQFVAELANLSQTQWETPSLCQGWSVRDLCCHLLMPYELGTARFLGSIVKARLSFDRLADQWVTRDRRSGPDLAAALSVTTAASFAVPGAGPLAALAHLSIHSEDVRCPLGLPGAVAAPSAGLVLDDVTSGKHSVGADRLSGLRFVATDADWSLGAGPEVSGTASTLLSALHGRRESAAVLTGAGADAFRARVA